jgi:hypothetical protein
MVRKERYYDECGLTAAETDAMIVKMKAQGYRLKDIAAAVHLSPSGVHRALERISDGRPGRPPRV